MFADFWRKLTAGAMRKQSQVHHLTPRLEVLEDRCLLTAAIAEFPVITANSSPFGITAGPDGNVWFTEATGNKIGMINPTTHDVSEYAIPTAGGPAGIAAGPDGNLWFTETNANNIGMINPSTHTVTEFPITTAGSGATAIIAGPDGNLWFTESAVNQIGEINPTSHTITEFAVPTSNSSPTGIAVGPDGNIWFTENGSNKVATINPTTHAFTEYPTPKGSTSQPYGITAGSDGNMWFTESNGNRIGEVVLTTKAVNEYAIPTGSSGARGIAAGPDGNLWFTEAISNNIGQFNPTTLAFTEIAAPTASVSPTWITAGPGGTLWFSEASGNNIGEIVTPSIITTAPVSQTVTEGQSASFTAAATAGMPTPTVFWQVSTNAGVTYTPLTNGGIYSGVTTDTLFITGTTTAMSGYRYEAVFSNGIAPNPTVTTNAAILTVNSVLSIVPALPQGIIGSSYIHTVSVVGSTALFTLFAVNNFNAGTTGLTFGNITTNTTNGTITVSGTPTGVGTATFTVAVANTAGNSLTQTLTITIRPPLSIGTLTLPQATAGAIYSQSINIVGGAMPFATFNVSNFNGGTTGLNANQIAALSATGIFQVSGMPTAAGTATFTVNVTDSLGTSVTQNYTITVNPALAITAALPQGTASSKYNQVLTVTGGGVPYTTLSVTNFSAGTTGMTLGNITTSTAAGTFTINGNPTAAGTLTFTANVIDAIGAPLSKTYTVKINPALTISPSTLSQGTSGISYKQTIKVTGGTTPYTTFTVTGFSAGNTGLTAAAIVTSGTAGTIAISGTPTGSGTLTFTVNVTDTAQSILTKTFSVVINPIPTIGSLSVTQWTAGKSSFTGALTIAGGTGPFTLTSFTGLPTGLSAVVSGSTISLTGMPITVGTFASGKITLHDAVGATAAQSFSITINPSLALSALAVTQWTAGRPGFTGSMTESGGTGGVTISASSGVPTGMAIVLNGKTLGFSGTPTVPGTYAGSVTLRDTVGATVIKTFSIVINAAPTIGTLTTTQWTTGKSGFTGVMTINAGTSTFKITSSSGLPTGMTASINGNTIGFTGTPSVAQTFAAGSITIQDAAGASVSKNFSITINPAISITTTSLPSTSMALLYNTPVLARGGTGTLTFTVTAGSLPTGMKISSNGIITGATRGFGTFTFTITVTDAVGATFSKQFSIAVARVA